MITFYGAKWCGDCRRSMRVLDELEVAFNYIDLEKEPSEYSKVIEINRGARSIPVIVFSDKTHLTEPSDDALRAKLAELSIA